MTKCTSLFMACETLIVVLLVCSTVAAEPPKVKTRKNTAAGAPDRTQSSEMSEGLVELVPADGIALTELILSKGIENRAPLDPGVVFRIGEFERIYAFFKVANPDAVEDEVYVSWAPENGGERGRVSVRIGPQKQWRTWAFSKLINRPGNWQVVIRDRDDRMLGRAVFRVTD